MSPSTLPRGPRVDLDVTEKIITSSCREDSSHCMLADAVRAAFPGAKRITVDIQTIRFSDPTKGLRYTYLTPRIAQLALVDFDAGVPPDPFTCVLRGAHVAQMASRHRIRNPDSTPEALAARQAAAAKARKYTTHQASVRPGSHTDDSTERVGGRTPPLGALAAGTLGRPRPHRSARNGDIPTARRRTYGLRALQRNIPVNPDISAESDK